MPLVLMQQPMQPLQCIAEDQELRVEQPDARRADRSDIVEDVLDL
jgi:hypothetical protein